MVLPKLAEAGRAIGFEDERGDGRRDQNGVSAAGVVFWNHRLDWSLKRRVLQRGERRGSYFGVVARVEDHNCLGGDCVRGSQARANGFEHGLIGIARSSMERASAEHGGDGIGFVAKDNDHFIANRTDGVVGGTNERLGSVDGRPRLQLLGAAHAAATTGGQ